MKVGYSMCKKLVSSGTGGNALYCVPVSGWWQGCPVKYLDTECTHAILLNLMVAVIGEMCLMEEIFLPK